MDDDLHLYHVVLTTKVKDRRLRRKPEGKLRARSIRPKFPEIPVQNRMEQKLSGNLFRKFGSPLEVTCDQASLFFCREIKGIPGVVNLLSE